jgi:hypothetical protein
VCLEVLGVFGMKVRFKRLGRVGVLCALLRKERSW